jgi:pimeloyl-ACP methyl ester carboxylesterase
MVFLHGNGESGASFEKSALFFSKDCTVITIDSRGHGDSDLGGEALTIINMSEDLYAVLNHLKIPKATIVGFSDGANIAMVFASKHPQRVDKLILCGGNYNNSGLTLSFRIQAGLSCFLAKVAAKLDSTAERNYKLLALMTENQHIEESMLKKITAETLVMAGDKDLIKEAHTRKIAKLIPTSQLKIIKNMDHFYPYRDNDGFNKTIKEFLTKS